MNSASPGPLARHLAVLLLITATSAQAEEARHAAAPPQVDVGSRVRFTGTRHGGFPAGRSVVGTITAAEADSITVERADGSRVAIARSTPGRLEVEVKREKKLFRSMLVGAAVLSLMTAGGSPGYSLGPSAGPQMSQTAFTLGAAACGAAIGALREWAQPDQKWARASLERVSPPGPTPTSPGAHLSTVLDVPSRGVGLQFRFGW